MIFIIIISFRFHYDIKEDRFEVQIADLSLHEIEIAIVNAVDLPFAPNSTKLTHYILNSLFIS